MTESTPTGHRPRRRTVLLVVCVCVVGCAAAVAALVLLSDEDEPLSVDPWSAFFEDADADVVGVELIGPDSSGVTRVRATVQNSTTVDRDYDVTVAVTSPDGAQHYARTTVEIDEVEAESTASGSAVLDVTDLPGDAVVRVVDATRTR